MADLVREVVIDATPETIFPFLTERDQYLRWNGTEAEIDARPGGVYRVMIAGSFAASGEFVEVVPNEKVVYTFGWEAEGVLPRPGSTTVEITLHPEGTSGKTRVRLVHHGLADEQAVTQHGMGWEHYLGRLSVAASGGDPGPDAGSGGAG